jgi:hypothetical protein
LVTRGKNKVKEKIKTKRITRIVVYTHACEFVHFDNLQAGWALWLLSAMRVLFLACSYHLVCNLLLLHLTIACICMYVAWLGPPFTCRKHGWAWPAKDEKYHEKGEGRLFCGGSPAVTPSIRTSFYTD